MKTLLTVDKVRQKLAEAYQIIALLGWDDSTYTHLTHRHPTKDHFFISKFGLFFEEVTPENLLEVDFSGKIISSGEFHYNQTGYAIHSALYQSKPEVQAIFHLHTPESIAVSAEKEGLLPISQHAYHFYDRVSYFEYDSLTLHQSTQGAALAKALKRSNPILMLRNHGTVVCGSSIEEAFFFQYHLQKACKVQCLLGKREGLVIPSPEVCNHARDDLLSFEENLGQRDWIAYLRKIKKQNSKE
jgi:ribulose-5-phosphate 4-epimerase/fuculose-1-phosphate aldolase